MLCMSETSEKVFAAFMQMYTDTQCSAYMPLTPPRGRAPVGSVVHHHAVQGGSFVLKCSGTCQTTRVIVGKMHSQSPILKCYRGAQQPSNSYKSMRTKLHPPHSNQTCHKCRI